MNFKLSLVAVLACSLQMGCQTFSLRNDFYNGQPLWESNAFKSAGEKRIANSGGTIKEEVSPGLYYLANQVLGDELKQPASKVKLLKSDTKRAPAKGQVAQDDNPLPSEIAKLTFTKAYVASLVASHTATHLDDYNITPDNLREFGLAVLKSQASMVQSNKYESYEEGQIKIDRLSRIAQVTSDGKMTFGGLVFEYFSAYYYGDFVDRNGGALSKPGIGLKITNDTITNAEIVFIEAMNDYAVYGDPKARIAYPIVYTQDAGKEPVFVNGTKKTPTLFTVVEKLIAPNRKPTDPVVNLERVIEAALTDAPADASKNGLSAEKLKYVRTWAGTASDLAGGATDIILRALGGIDIGVAFANGKFSIGDNDTFTKVVQTGVELGVRRATEDSIATYLYYSHKKSAAAIAAGTNKGHPGTTIDEIFDYEP